MFGGLPNGFDLTQGEEMSDPERILAQEGSPAAFRRDGTAPTII